MGYEFPFLVSTFLVSNFRLDAEKKFINSFQLLRVITSYGRGKSINSRNPRKTYQKLQECGRESKIKKNNNSLFCVDEKGNKEQIFPKRKRNGKDFRERERDLKDDFDPLQGRNSRLRESPGNAACDKLLNKVGQAIDVGAGGAVDELRHIRHIGRQRRPLRRPHPQTIKSTKPKKR